MAATTWKLRRSGQQYQQVLIVLEREEERDKLLRGVPEFQEEVVVNRLAQAPVRPWTYNYLELATRRYIRGEREKGILDEKFELLKNLKLLPDFDDLKKKIIKY